MSATMNAELRRIQIASARFGELQGLRVAFLGTNLFIVFGAYFLDGPGHGRAIWIGAALAVGLTIPGAMVLDRYYASTFGRMVPKQTRLGVISSAAGGLSIFLYRHFGIPPAIAALLLPAVAFSLIAAVRDFPVRSYHVAGVGATIVAILLPTTPAGQAAPNTAIAAGLLLFGVTYIPIGFLDHRLLVTAMRGWRPGESNEMPGDYPR